MKAVGIARVSTKEQEELGFSIPAQVARIKEFASGKGFPEILIHEFAESSTKDSRKKFEKIIRDAQESEESTALFVDTIDRLQRDFKESVQLDELRKQGKIEIYFFRENLRVHKDSNSSEIMRWDIGVLFAKQYIGQLRDNVNRTIDEKLEEGEWISMAPLGYININKDDLTLSKKSEGRDCEKWIIPDPDRRHYIVKAFELFSTGLYSVQGLAKEMAKQGLTTKDGKRVGKSVLHKTLRNPFYCGQMKPASRKKLYNHKYECIIESWLFDKCQRILEGRASNERGTQYNKKEFLFKGLIRCKCCQSVLSTYTQKGTNYVRCHACKSVHEREDHFEKQIESVFKQISIPEDVMIDLVSILKESYGREQEYTKKQQDGLLNERTKIAKRISISYEDRLDGRITGNEYDKIVCDLKKKDRDILAQLTDHSNGDEAFLITTSYILELAHRAYMIFKNSQTGKKRELINFVFANFEADGGKLLYKTKEPLGEVLRCSLYKEWLPLVDLLRTKYRPDILEFSRLFECNRELRESLSKTALA